MGSYSKVSELFLKENFKPLRGGVILYCDHNNEKLFGLGIDYNTRDITDFGGGIKQTETFLKACLREFDEESLGVFSDLIEKTPEEELMNYYAVYNHYSVAIFIKIPYEEYYQRTLIFKEKVKKIIDENRKPEVINISWFNYESLNKIINSENKDSCGMYNVIKLVLKNIPLTVIE